MRVRLPRIIKRIRANIKKCSTNLKLLNNKSSTKSAKSNLTKATDTKKSSLKILKIYQQIQDPATINNSARILIVSLQKTYFIIDFRKSTLKMHLTFPLWTSKNCRSSKALVMTSLPGKDFLPP